jgi:hypothetical protein
MSSKRFESLTRPVKTFIVTVTTSQEHMNNFATIRSAAALALIVTAAACSSQTPANPTQSTAAAATAAPTAAPATDGKASVTLTTPQLASPVDSQQIRFAEQPITLAVKNAVATGSGALTYTFQVASDAGFASLVYSKDGVAAGSSATTSQVIDSLAGGKTYFWRASASSGGTAGPFTKARSFSLLAQVVLQTPVAVSPIQNATITGTPNLTVNNVGRSGPNAPLVYQFDVSNSAAFSQILFTTTVAEQPGQTSASVSNKLPNGTYFWRARAIDGFNLVTTAYLAAASFNYQNFNMASAIIQASPTDVGSWPETAKITSVSFTGGAMQVDFDRRTGANRWPDEPFGDGSIEYTLGMCVNINGNGQWYCSAVVQFWFGRDLTASGSPGAVASEWFYDPARWGAMTGYQPREGETVGFFVASGNVRGRTDPSTVNCPRICERSNVAFVPFTMNDSSSFGFSAGRVSLNGK